MRTDDPVLDLMDRFTAALNSHGLDEGDERHQRRELVIVVVLGRVRPAGR